MCAALAGTLLASCSSASDELGGEPSPDVVVSAEAPTTTAATSMTTSVPATSVPVTSPPTTEVTLSTTSTTTSTTLVPVSSTAYGEELSKVDASGTRSLESALRLFSIAIAPLPGVDAPFDRSGVRSGTLALKHVLAHYDELTPEQQAVVDAARVPPAGSDIIVVPAGFGRPSQTLRDIVAAAAIKYRADFAAKIGEIPGVIDVIVGELTDLFGQSDPQFEGGSYSGCTVTIDPVMNTDPTTIANTVAHEIFHCFQAAGAKTTVVWNEFGDWVLEGSAQWAADVLTQPDGNGTEWWTAYLTEIQVPLFTRTYEAIGFFSHLAETGTDPWSVFPAMFAAVGSAAAFDASGANGDAFMTSWASSFLREPARSCLGHQRPRDHG